MGGSPLYSKQFRHEFGVRLVTLDISELGLNAEDTIDVPRPTPHKRNFENAWTNSRCSTTSCQLKSTQTHDWDPLIDPKEENFRFIFPLNQIV